MSQESVLLFSV